MDTTHQHSHRILVVDDEDKVLGALKRRLSQLCPDAEVTVAHGGDEAIEMSSHRDFDLVISDLRMPKPDGERLLNFLRRYHPETVRVILSGQATSEMLLAALPVSHQYLEKPCPTERLSSVVQAMDRIADARLPQTLRKHLLSLRGLPTDPSSVQHAQRLLNDKESSEELARIFATDVGLAIGLLRMATVMGSVTSEQLKVVTPGMVSTPLLAQLLASPLIVPVEDNSALLRGVRITGIKVRLLADQLRKRGVANPAYAALVAYVGELALIFCFGVWSDHLAAFQLFRDEATRFLWTLWGLPVSHCAVCSDLRVAAARHSLDELFPIEEHALITDEEVLRIYREVLCLID